MTRRILRGFADGAQSIDTHVDWRHALSNGYQPAEEPSPSTTARDSEEMLARVSRTESEAQNAYRKIEDQLRGVGRRLDATERSQSENNRAMSKAAAEINIAAREQAQAFDQLGAHVVGLNDRLIRLEREAANDGIKDAIKALHQGLSRLADQMSQTANQSASQIAALAGNVEQVAGKLIEARADVDQNTRLLEDRILNADERAYRVERSVQAGASSLEKVLEAVAALQEARKVADADLQRQVSALTQLGEAVERLNTRLNADEAQQSGTMARLEESVAGISSRESDHSDALSRLEESVSRISGTEIEHSESLVQLKESVSRISSAEAQHSQSLMQLQESVANISKGETSRSSSFVRLEESVTRIGAGAAHNSGAIERLEETLAKLNARGTDVVIDQRLRGVERSLSDIAGRLERTERRQAGAAGDVEETLRNLTLQVDAADKRHREALAELRAAVKEASGNLTVDPAPPKPAPALDAAPIFDLPPFPDSDSSQHAIQETFSNASPPPTPPLIEPPPTPPSDEAFSAPPFGPDAFVTSVAPQSSAVEGDSFLAAARRSALAASAADADQPAGSLFSGLGWGAARQPTTPKRNPFGRHTFIALLGFLIVGAVVAGVFLSRSLNSATTAPATGGSASPAPTPVAPTHVATLPSPDNEATTGSSPTPSSAAPISATAATGQATPRPVPGSPHVSPARLKRTHAASAQVRTAPPALQPMQVSQPAAQASASSPDRLSALASTGNAKAQMLLGLKYLDGDGTPVNEAEAAKWLERAAGQNEAIAAYRLGTLYERGHGMPADAAKAVRWYETAAKEGNRKAMHNLAVAYAQGNGVQKNLVVAAQWFTRAANLGLADSQFNLAVLFERGMGVQQSLLDAYKWYAIAAAQGDAESKARIDALSTQLNADDKAAAQKAADSFHPQQPDRIANVPPDSTAVLGG